jgi:hypothetical protein
MGKGMRHSGRAMIPTTASRNTGLSPEDLDRRVNILNKWWIGMLEMLNGKNNQSISGTVEMVAAEKREERGADDVGFQRARFGLKPVLWSASLEADFQKYVQSLKPFASQLLTREQVSSQI